MLNLKSLWRNYSSGLDVNSKMLDLWRVNLNQSKWKISELHHTLSTEEKKRANRFLFEKHKNYYVVGRGYLRFILGCYLGAAPNSIQISYGKYGKPQLSKNNVRNKLKFNLSHSEDLAIYAITYDRNVGIDVEFVDHDRETGSLTNTVFSKNNIALIKGLSREGKKQEFYKGWTIKEAYLKATGEGLAGIDQIEFSMFPGKSAKLLHIDGKHGPITRWSSRQIIAQQGYIASLVVEGNRCLITAAYDV